MSNEQNQLIEIYKSQVQLICSISDRQTVMHRHHILVVSAIILGLYTLLGNMEKLNQLPGKDYHTEILIICTSILGILISYSWFDSINYYTYLVSCKHDSLKQLEKRLAYRFFEHEWSHLDENTRPQIYGRLSNHKLVVPMIFFVFFGALLALAGHTLHKVLFLLSIVLIIIPISMFIKRWFRLNVRSSR